MANVFDYIFNIGGNDTNQINGMTDASVAVEGYKLVLSQLSPEPGKYQDAWYGRGNMYLLY